MKKAIAELRIKLMETGFNGTTDQLEYTINKFMLSLQTYVTPALIETFDPPELYGLFRDWVSALQGGGLEGSNRLIVERLWLVGVRRQVTWDTPDEKVVSMFGGG